LGELKNFEEQPIDANTQEWTNALESYELKPLMNETELIVRVDTMEQYVDHMK